MMEKFFRPDLAALEPLTVPDGEGKCRLNLNECPYPFPPEVWDEIRSALARKPEFNRYGDPYQGTLREAVAEYAEVEPEQVLLGNGSDELIYQLHLAFGGRGRRLAASAPIFPSYQIYSTIVGTEFVPVNLGENFSLPVDNLLREAAREDTPLVAVCNPNNPTGNLFPTEELHHLVAGAPSLVVIDEAYYEYAGQTLAADLDRHPNLIILRTLSKAFAAAGIRIGYLLAHPALIQELKKVKIPFNLGIFPQIVGPILLKHKGAFLAIVEQIKAERERVAAGLALLPGVKVFPSHTNFLLVSIPRDTDKLARRLQEENVLISNVGKNPHLAGCLRIGIGSREENDALLAAMKKILG